MEAYNDNQVEVASRSIDTILCAPEHLNAILVTEITLDGARYLCQCLLALLAYHLSLDSRLGEELSLDILR